MDRRERKSHLTDPTQMPSDEYKKMMDLKRNRDRDELGAYGRGTPYESVGLREPPYRASMTTHMEILWVCQGTKSILEG